MIPRDLTDLKQWIACDERTKIPHGSIHGELSNFDETRGYGTGFVFLPSDGLIGIDLDDCIVRDGITHSLTPFAQRLLTSLPENAYIELSTSGCGLHVIVRGDKPTHNFRRKEVEVYGSGRYFLITGREFVPFDHSRPIGTIHPGVLESLKPKETVTRTAPVVMDRPENALERARAYVHSYPPAISGQRGHDHTYRLVAKLIEGFGLTESETFDLIDPWNRGCDPPWTDREMLHKIRSVLNRTSARGTMYSEDGGAGDVEVAGLISAEYRRGLPIPEHLLEVPGWIGSFMDWCMSQNHRKNRSLALLGGLAWACHLTGRRIQDDSGVRTNLYLVGLAPSSGGKQAPLECVKLLAEMGHRPDAVIGKVTSDSAIAQHLTREPNTLALWDEFGLFLQRTGGKTSSTSAVQDALLELWGACRTTWRAKTYADSAKDLVIPQPCFSMIGMSTPDHFWQGLTRMHLRDGFAGRLLVIDSGPRADRGQVSVSDPPEDLIEVERDWTESGRCGNLADFGFGRSRVPIVKVTDEANAIFEDLLDRIDSETDDDRASIWGRSIEKARKLAILYACSRSTTVRVDREAARWGADLAIWSAEAFLDRVGRSVVGSDSQHATLTREVLVEIGKTGSISKRSLLTSTGASVQLLASVMDTLVESGRVAMHKNGREIVYTMR